MELSLPPSMDVVGPAGRALGRYEKLLERMGARTSVIAFAALPAAFTFLFLFALSINVCGEGCGFVAGVFLLPATYLALALFLVALALVLARRSLRRARRDLVVTTALRVQGLKDWFVRGDVTEAEFEHLRQKMEFVRAASAPYMKAQDAGVFCRKLAGLLLVTAVPALAVLVMSFLALSDGAILAVPFAFVALFGAIANGWGLVGGIRRGRELLAVAERLGAAQLRDIDETEARLLRDANRRKTGMPSPASQPYHRASFRSFLGR